MVETLVSQMADIMPPASVSVWRCVPIANIASAGEPDLWEAVDGDPQFRIMPSNLPIQSGWYRLRASFREIEVACAHRVSIRIMAKASRSRRVSMSVC